MHPRKSSQLWLSTWAPILSFVALIFTFAMPGPLPAADKTPPTTHMAQRGKLLLAETFEQPPNKSWVVRAPDWETVDGALKATHRKPYDTIHGPVLHHDIALPSGAVLELSFKPQAKARTVVHFDKRDGHLCRVVLTPDAFFLIRRDDGPVNATRLAERQTPIAANQWHTLVIELAGNEMLATLDGRQTIFGGRDDLGQPKTRILLEASSGSVWFKNLRVWEASPNKNWPTTKQSLLKTRPAAN